MRLRGDVGLWQTMDAEDQRSARDLVAQRKAYQLRLRRRWAANPATLMTNDPAEARRFVDARGYRDIVYKSFSSTERSGGETRLLKEEELHLDHAACAGDLQHYVEARYDLRITAVGSVVSVDPLQETEYKVDSRIDIGSAKVRRWKFPMRWRTGFWN
jgi:hypothetical protein